MSFALLNDIETLFSTGIGEIDYAAYTVTGSDFNPNASVSPNLGLQVPVDADMSPQNSSAFTGSILKIANGRSNETFNFKDRAIAAGQKGCVDFCDQVSNVTLIAQLFGYSWNERITSVKGCNKLTLQGAITGNGSYATHILGRFYAEGKLVDTSIDYSAVARAGDTIVIARGLFPYLFGNKNKITLGAIKLSFFKSLAECWYVHIKDLFVKAKPVVVTADNPPPLATP